MLKTIIVGCGRIAQAHLAAMVEVKGMQCIGAVDSNAATLKAFHEKYSLPMFGDIAEAIEATRPDAAILAVPPMLHAKIGGQLLDAGLHVLCEKPLAPKP
jgi:predicted dehydrogenase